METGSVGMAVLQAAKSKEVARAMSTQMACYPCAVASHSGVVTGNALQLKGATISTRSMETGAVQTAKLSRGVRAPCWDWCHCAAVQSRNFVGTR
jgi:hypothetical protein